MIVVIRGEVNIFDALDSILYGSNEHRCFTSFEKFSNDFRDVLLEDNFFEESFKIKEYVYTVYDLEKEEIRYISIDFGYTIKTKVDEKNESEKR